MEEKSEANFNNYGFFSGEIGETNMHFRSSQGQWRLWQFDWIKLDQKRIIFLFFFIIFIFAAKRIQEFMSVVLSNCLLIYVFFTSCEPEIV